jgi:hypothetical protein
VDLIDLAGLLLPLGIIAWLAYERRVVKAPEPRMDEKKQTALRDLQEVEQRLAELLRQSRETLASDLEVLRLLREEIHNIPRHSQPEDQPPEQQATILECTGESDMDELQMESEVVAECRIDESAFPAFHREVLDLLNTGLNCEEAARKLNRSASEIRLISQLAASHNSTV